MVTGAYAYKYKELYYSFLIHDQADFHNIGKQIVDELRKMKSDDFEKMKELIDNIEDFTSLEYDGDEYYKDFKSKYNKKFNGLLSDLTSVVKNKFVDVQISEIDEYTYYNRQLNYIYIIDIDDNLFKTKYYTYTIYDESEFDFKNGKFESVKIESIDVNTYELNNIPDIWN